MNTSNKSGISIPETTKEMSIKLGVIFDLMKIEGTLDLEAQAVREIQKQLKSLSNAAEHDTTVTEDRVKHAIESTRSGVVVLLLLLRKMMSDAHVNSPEKSYCIYLCTFSDAFNIAFPEPKEVKPA